MANVTKWVTCVKETMDAQMTRNAVLMAAKMNVFPRTPTKNMVNKRYPYFSFYILLAAYWRYQTHVKKYRIFSRVLLRLKILVYHCIYMYVYVYVYVCMYIYIYIYIYVCMYTHTHTHIYIYIYMYVYTHTHTYTVRFDQATREKNLSGSSDLPQDYLAI